MRTIKFRIWDIQQRCFIDTKDIRWGKEGVGETGELLIDFEGNLRIAAYPCGNGDNSADSVFESLAETDSKKYILQQFTGLLDANGKEIYEGDLVKIDPKHITVVLRVPEIPHYTCGEVIWLREGFCVAQEHLGSVNLSEFVACECCPCGLEIIGFKMN